MEKITIKFSGQTPFKILSSYITVVLTLDETGKNVSFEESEIGIERPQKAIISMEAPKRVIKAFTESAVSRILSGDKIPNESGMMVLDGYIYTIIITRGELTKEYVVDDSSIETYSLLRYLASWYRRI